MRTRLQFPPDFFIRQVFLPKRPFSHSSLWVLGVLAGAFAALPVQGDDIPWTGAVDNDWSTESNWAGGAVPGDSDIAEFHDPGAGNLNVTLSSGSTIDGLALNANATSPVTIHVTTGTPLTLDGGAATDISVVAGSHSIEGNGAGSGDLPELFALGANQVWDVAAGATLVIDARLRAVDWPGGTTYSKTGAGTLVLGGSNSGGGGWIFHGSGFQLRAGTLKVAHPNATGNWHNDYTVSDGATIEPTGGISLFEMRNGTLALQGDGVSGVGALYVTTGTGTNFPGGNGQLYLASNTTIGVSAGTTFTISQKITGTGLGASLTKAGEGLLVLTSEENSYGGSGSGTKTTVSAGTLTLAAGAELRFRVGDNGDSHSIIGTAKVNLDGLLRLDVTSVTDTQGAWDLVDVDSLEVTWGETFGLAFMDEEAPPFADQGDGVFTSGDWTFRQATGRLILGPEPAEQIRLTAERVTNNELQLSWPVSAEDHVLETTPSLTMGDWQPVAATPEVQEGFYILILPMEEDAAFYRLRIP